MPLQIFWINQRQAERQKEKVNLTEKGGVKSKATIWDVQL